MMSSDEDENGRIKKHKQPFSPNRKVTFDYQGNLMNVNDPTFGKNVNQQIVPRSTIKDYGEDGSVLSGETRSRRKSVAGSRGKASPLGQSK